MANSREEMMQRRLKDYLQSSGTISGYVEDFENLFTELEASGYRHIYDDIVVRVSSDYPGSKKRRFHIKDTKKIGCNAWLTVKCVRVYDDFSISKTSSMQSEAREKLKEALQSSSPPAGRLRFYSAASIDHSHSQILCEMNMRIHPTLLKEIEKIVKSGVTSTREIKFHFKRFVDNMFGEDSVPNATNKAFYPSKSVIYTHTYKTICNERKTKFDQEAPGKEVEKWKKLAPNDQFFFQAIQ